MALLANKVKKWVEHDLLSAQQGERILSFEKSQNTWQGAMVVFLGIMVVALGLSAIIAANWDLTPGWFKLAGNGFLLVAIVFFSWRCYTRGRGLLFEFALLFFLLYVLASIGLIGQVFHTGSPYYAAFFLWCFMTVGVMPLSRHMPVPALWLAGLGVALFGYMWDNLLYEDRVLQLLPHLGMAYAILALLFGLLLGKASPQAKAAGFIFCLFLIAGALTNELMESYYFVGLHEKFDDRGSFTALTCAAMVLLWLSRQFSLWQKIALSLGGLWCLGIVYHLFRLISLSIHHGFMEQMDRYSVFADPVSSFSLLAWLSFYAVASGYRRLFLLWLTLAGLRISAVFLLASYGLWQTGLALLVSGAILVSIPLLWKKYLRDRLFTSPTGLMANPAPELAAPAPAGQERLRGKENEPHV